MIFHLFYEKYSEKNKSLIDCETKFYILRENEALNYTPFNSNSLLIRIKSKDKLKRLNNKKDFANVFVFDLNEIDKSIKSILKIIKNNDYKEILVYSNNSYSDSLALMKVISKILKIELLEKFIVINNDYDKYNIILKMFGEKYEEK